MRLKIIKIILGAALFIAFFAGAALVTNYINNLGREKVAVEMPGESLNAIYAEVDGEKVNYMPAYRTALNTSLYRDSIIPVGEDKTVKILVPNTGKSNNNICYELRDESGSTLIENGDMEYDADVNGFNRYETSIRMDLSEGREYSFIVKTSKENEQIYYYTRLIRLKSNKIDVLSSYAEEFSRATFAADKKTLATELEMAANEAGSRVAEGNESDDEDDSDSSVKVASATDAASVTAEDIENVLRTSTAIVDKNYLGLVSLDSSFDAVTWGSLKPEKVGETIRTIKEVSEESAVVSFSYVITAFNSGASENLYYSVEEIYELSLSQDTGKASISDYHRYMNRAFTGNRFVQSTNSINIGAVSSFEAEYITTDDCEKIAFVADGCLWYFDYNEGWVTKVYGVETSASSPASKGMKRYSIDCLKINDSEVEFIVYGRIPWGNEEGKEGVALYKYNVKTATVSQVLFIETDLSYTALKSGAEKVAAYNDKNGMFYTIIGQKLVSYDTKTGQEKDITTDLMECDIKASKDRNVVAYPDTSNETEVKNITLTDLASGKSTEINVPGKIVTSLGFIGNDFVYGVSDSDNIKVGADGIASYLFDSINIVKRDGSLAKKYEKEGVLISDLTFLNNTIYLIRVRKDVDSGEIESVDPDYISYKTEDEKQIVSNSFNSSEQTLDELNLKFPDFIYMYSSPIEKVTKYDRKGVVEGKISGEINKSLVYVFQGRDIKFESKSIGRAIRSVKDEGGYVVSYDGNILYRHKKGALYLTVAGTFDYKSVETDDESFGACLYMGLLSSGNKISYDEIKDNKDWEKAFEEFGGNARGLNLTGADLDIAILYLGEGIPFATKIGDRYVMVVSFNSEAIRYYDPVLGTEVKLARSSFKEDVEEAGDEFYLYIK